jgi:hypothetical protein
MKRMLASARMARGGFRGGFLSSRRWRFGCFFSALIVLGLAAIWFNQARGRLATAYDELARHQQQHAQALQTEALLIKEVERSELMQKVLEVSRTDRMGSTQWGERRISLQSATMTRREINDLLAGVSHQPGRLFGAEKFDLSVSRPEDGLFTLLGGSLNQPPLVITLEGTLLFRIDRL